MCHTVARIRRGSTTTFGILLATASVAAAQPGTGAKYGARDARNCTVRAPQGAPTAAQAALAVGCSNEHESDGRYLYLLQDVHVDVGRGRPFQYATDAFQDVDPKATVYPVRGNFMKYQCTTRDHEQAMGNDPNRNCTATSHARATGICFTTTFGDLRCTFGDFNAEYSRTPVAPPR